MFIEFPNEFSISTIWGLHIAALVSQQTIKFYLGKGPKINSSKRERMESLWNINNILGAARTSRASVVDIMRNGSVRNY